MAEYSPASDMFPQQRERQGSMSLGMPSAPPAGPGPAVGASPGAPPQNGGGSNVKSPTATEAGSVDNKVKEVLASEVRVEPRLMSLPSAG